jgi:DNA-binding NarL/FixJ family response regulator
MIKSAGEAEMSKIRLIFVDGNEVSRALFGYVLEDSSGIEVVGEAADRNSAMELIREFAPDAIIIGYDLPPREQSELRSCLSSEFPETRIIELSDLDAAISNRLGGKASRQFQYSRMIH